MINDHNVYLPTDKFYSIPKYEDYTQAKNKHLQNLGENYQTHDVKAKWPLLMTAFSEALQVDDMPANLSVVEFKRRLAEFKSKRENTSISLFNLSLAQCGNYFEEFYFLYTTTDPRYQLTPAAKKALLNSIKEAIGTCETGINGRFYTALQDHKKDSDWIQNELSKARCETLHQLHHQYGGEDVHTYNKLVALANQDNLGIATKEEILDIHAGMVDSSAVKAFFYKHYPTLFETYEKETIDNLTNHYLSELASTLEIDSADWDAGELDIPLARVGELTIALNSSLNGHFDNVDTTCIVDSLLVVSEDFTEFTLKKKQDVAPIIKRLVTAKLLADQYYVSLDAVADNREGHQHIRMKKGVVLDDLIKMHQTLKQNNTPDIQKALSRDTSILMHYSELILSHIKSNAALLSKIPHWLKTDTRFVDAAILTLDEMLCEAITAHHHEEITNLTTQILNLIQSETAYIEALSLSVRTHPLVESRLPKTNNVAFDWQKANIDSSEFINHVDSIYPMLLLEIIETRKQLDLSPLPFFDNDQAIHDLKQFHQDLETRLAPRWNEPYLSTRRRACEQENFACRRDPLYKKNAVTYLSQTNTWFAGFNQYRAYQTSFEKLWLELIVASIACYELALSMIKIGAFLWVFENIIPLITQIIQPFFWELILSSTALSAANYLFIGSRLLATASDILWRIALLDLDMYINVTLRLIMEVIRCAYKVYVVADAMFTILSTCFNIIEAMLSPLWQDTYPHRTLEDTSENILIRLDGIDNASAQEKSHVLRALLSHVKADVSEKEGHSFAELLNHKYSIYHQGDQHEVSFSDVCRMRRPHDGHFQLEEKSSCMRFFSGQTSSEAFLTTAETASMTL